MENSEKVTIGREIYPGFKVRIYCINDTDFLDEHLNDRFRIVYVKEGHGIFQNNGSNQIITGPAVLCLNDEDHVTLVKAIGIKMDVMVFDPRTFSRNIDANNLAEWKNDLGEDAFFFFPFFSRTSDYIGAFSTNYAFGNRISKLISQAKDELAYQKDESWPCRSRSFFIELLLNVNSVYRGELTQDKVFSGKISDDIMDIIEWVQIHYLDKVILEDITKEFHTNKTTLNQKFKATMGVTVMEYILSLRMQIACSFLRKTYLPVSEIMERSGYRDDAHFLRSFKKYVGCTPTEYRKQFE